MRLHIKFGVWLGGFFLLFWVIASVLFHYYFRNQIEQQAFATSQQIVEQVDASQRYVRETLRPVMADLVGPEEFIPEAMSTTFVSRNTIERFQEKYPDYYFKFATDNPRNPVNLADEIELQIIAKFENDPTLTRWEGQVQRAGQPYLTVATPIVFNASCMSCHGNPADAPASLLERYGDTAGFYRQVGEVAIKSVGVPVSDALGLARDRTLVFAGLAGVFLIGLTGLTFFLFRTLVTRPVETLRKAATEISEGNLEQRVDLERKDELGKLGGVFNAMASKMSALVNTLEQSITERTADLEQRSADLAARSAELEQANRQLAETARQNQRRADLLQASTQVSRAVAEVRDVDQLLSEVTHLISQHFGFYHAGIFLIDEAGRYAVLRAANSEGGRKMLAHQHKLEVGATGIVGFVTSSAKPRIALDVGEDAVHFKNPDLPQTRSEMAVPLRVGDEIIGALDVQSVEEAAFSEEDVAVLTALADQIAIAIHNARLFQQTQAALREVESTYRRYLRQEWDSFMGVGPRSKRKQVSTSTSTE